MLTKLSDILPISGNINLVGFVEYWCDEYKEKLINDEKQRLFSNLALCTQHNKPFCTHYTQQFIAGNPITPNRILMSLNTYYINFEDCDIGDICYYESPDEDLKLIEIDHDEFHFEKMPNKNLPLWLRVK